MINIMSCDKSEVDGIGPSDYLVFGHYYGKCFGEGCVETFKLEDRRLLEATFDQYAPQSFYNFEAFDVLSDAKFEAVKDLISFFPEELLSDERTIIGQPDAGDWGGIYVEIKTESIHRFWLLDQMDTDMPEKYNAFVDRINEKITLINQ